MGKKAKAKHHALAAGAQGSMKGSVMATPGVLSCDRGEAVSATRRLVAYAVDWAVGGVVSGLPAVFAYGTITGRSDMFSDLYVFGALGYAPGWGILVGVLCALFALAYYVVVPWKVWPGQTLGKRVTKVRIERDGGGVSGLGTLLVRQALVGFLMEGSAFVIGRYIRQTVTLALRFDVDTVWGYAGLAITCISAFLVLWHTGHKALHDYIAHTRVVACG